MMEGDDVKRIETERGLNVPIDEGLVNRVKDEARANGMQLREAVRDGLTLWLHTVSYLREQQSVREKDRADRKQKLE